MSGQIKMPKFLYKYRPFDTNTLKSLCLSEIYYADPKTFNDPIDCQPNLINDLPTQDLESLWFDIASDKYQNFEAARRQQNNYKYSSTEFGRFDDGGEGEEAYIHNLISDVKYYLGAEFKNIGVLSLSAKWNSTLMWAHYAANHSGICIEYKTEGHKAQELSPIRYIEDRSINLSDIHAWIMNGSESHKNKVSKQYFLNKDVSWNYEEEWRVLSRSSGQSYSPFEISGIYFGARCDTAIKIALVRLFGPDTINFSTVAFQDGANKLVSYALDADEAFASGVRQSPHFVFDDIRLSRVG